VRFGPSPLLEAVRPSNYPLPGGGTAVELSIVPELYQSAFAADLPSDVTEVLAVSQRPFAAILDDRAQAAAWKSLPAWAVVATADKAIPPDAERHTAVAPARSRSTSTPRTRSLSPSRRPSPI
jgi:hypothetical protein